MKKASVLALVLAQIGLLVAAAVAIGAHASCDRGEPAVVATLKDPTSAPAVLERYRGTVPVNDLTAADVQGGAVRFTFRRDAWSTQLIRLILRLRRDEAVDAADVTIEGRTCSPERKIL